MLDDNCRPHGFAFKLYMREMFIINEYPIELRRSKKTNSLFYSLIYCKEMTISLQQYLRKKEFLFQFLLNLSEYNEFLQLLILFISTARSVFSLI